MKKGVNMSMSKSMTDLHISGNTSSVLLNQVDENFQIDFESINSLAAQFEVNLPRIDDETDFRDIQENVEEYSKEIQEEISRTNQYSVEGMITNVANAENFEEANLSNPVFEESIEYESGFIPAKDFSIKLGTNIIPRFSCASHKNNIAVRLAIRKSPSLTKTLLALSSYASSVRVSILKSPIFIKKKVRLQVENKTLWSSSFLMLESFYRAYKANAFIEQNPCPVTFAKIQKYSDDF